MDPNFRDRAPRIERIDGGDHVVVEADQILSGIGLISNAGARFAAPETISAQGRFEDVLRGGYDPEQHLKDMALDGVAGEVLYPSQGLFYFKVADTPLMSAIFRAYNDWLAEFCRTDPVRLKGIAMINLDDIEDGIKELERAARLAADIDHHNASRFEAPPAAPYRAAAEESVAIRARRLQAYVGSGEHGARLRPLGDGTYARLRFPLPLPLAPGDRLVLRDPGTSTTFAGATVLALCLAWCCTSCGRLPL